MRNKVLYDLDSDLYELGSLNDDPVLADVMAELAARLNVLEAARVMVAGRRKARRNLTLGVTETWRSSEEGKDNGTRAHTELPQIWSLVAVRVSGHLCTVDDRNGGVRANLYQRRHLS